LVFLFLFLVVMGIIAILFFSKIRIEIIDFRFTSQTQRHILFLKLI